MGPSPFSTWVWATICDPTPSFLGSKETFFILFEIYANTTKCHNIFAIFFIPSCGTFQFEIIILFFTSTAFSQKILGEKLLLVLKLYIKNKQTKRQHKKIMCETMNFGSPNLTILKKKSKNTTKYYNIFTIPSVGEQKIGPLHWA